MHCEHTPHDSSRGSGILLVKAEFGKAYIVALKERNFLELIYEDSDPGIFTQEGVSKGIARYFCCRKDIETFGNGNKRLRLDVSEDES